MQEQDTPPETNVPEVRKVGEFELVTNENKHELYDNGNFQIGEEEAAWRRIRKKDQPKRRFKLK